MEYLDKVPSRADQLAKLAHGTERDPFDVLIIGGGATGTGCAVDAITRSAASATLVADTTPLYHDLTADRLARFVTALRQFEPTATPMEHLRRTLELGWRPCHA